MAADPGERLQSRAAETGRQVVLVRHGETEWSRTRRHTSFTDLPLTEAGRGEAGQLKPVLLRWKFALVLSSPRQRALDTARLAGFGDSVQVEQDLVEWNYGDYEGLTTPEIRQSVPGWTVFTHPSPGGETDGQVAARVDRVIARLRQAGGPVLLFAHAHVLRVLAARWLGQEPRFGRHLLLRTGTLSVLGEEHGAPAILSWNLPASFDL